MLFTQLSDRHEKKLKRDQKFNKLLKWHRLLKKRNKSEKWQPLRRLKKPI
jgi:hypothetical protein